MDNPGYVTLTRQQGLAHALDAIANNIANISTTGFRAERVEFAEFVKRTHDALGSVSMAEANPRFVDAAPGAFNRTDGALDLAISGDGFFLVETEQGPRLTRAGAFSVGPNGQIVNAEGYALLDAGGAPVFAPLNAGPIEVAGDGVISAGGEAVGQIGLFSAGAPERLRHAGGVLFESLTPPEPDETSRIVQGFLERSNVDVVREMSRMIAVQRAYEMSAQLATTENERIRQAVRSMGQAV